MTRIVVFPPGCERCGGLHLEFLERMSRRRPTEHWFRCDECGHFSTLPTPAAITAWRTPTAVWVLIAAAAVLFVGVRHLTSAKHVHHKSGRGAAAGWEAVSRASEKRRVSRHR
jgi:hypothetical protein